MVVPIAEAAAFLLKTGMFTPGAITTGEVAIELTAVAQQPEGAYLTAANDLVQSGGVKVAITTGTGPSKVEHFVAYSPMAQA